MIKFYCRCHNSTIIFYGYYWSEGILLCQMDCLFVPTTCSDLHCNEVYYYFESKCVATIIVQQHLLSYLVAIYSIAKPVATTWVTHFVSKFITTNFVNILQQNVSPQFVATYFKAKSIVTTYGNLLCSKVPRHILWRLTLRQSLSPQLAGTYLVANFLTTICGKLLCSKVPHANLR